MYGGAPESTFEENVHRAAASLQLDVQLASLRLKIASHKHM